MSFKMKYKIIKDYLPIRESPPGRRSGELMKNVRFTVAHDTGNPNTTARNNVNYYKNTYNKQSASAHIFVDDREIIECIPLLTGKPEKAFHVMYNKPTDNRIYGDDAIDIAAGVEYCYGNNIDADEAYKRYVWILAYIAYKFNQNPITDLIGHLVLDPERRTDPENGLSYSGRSYNQLILDVLKEYKECANDYDLIKLQNNKIIKGIKIEKDYLIPLSQVEDILMPVDVINYDKISYDKKEGDFVVLKKGDKGDKVRELQEKLILLGYGKYLAPWGSDGSFGNATYRAVYNFQKDYDLITDGIAGNQTWGKIESLLNQSKNYKHYKVGVTEVVEIDPIDLRISIQDKPANRVTLKNFVTSGYQWYKPNGQSYPLGILVSEGKIISNRQPHAYIPEQWLSAGTLLVYKDGTVKLKELSNLNNEKDVWFAVSGCSIYPEIKMKSAGFTGKFSDIARVTDRPIIGYRSKDNKIVIAVRSNSNIERAKQTAINLALDFAITLDAGGSTCLRVDNRNIFTTTRRLFSLITW